MPSSFSCSLLTWSVVIPQKARRLTADLNGIANSTTTWHRPG